MAEKKKFTTHEENYKAFFNTVQTGLFVTSLDGRLIDCNQWLVDMLGYSSKEEMLKVKVEDLYWDPADRQMNVQKASQEGVSSEMEFLARSKDGRKLDMLMNVSSIKDDNGEVISFLGSIHDMSDFNLSRRKLEESEAQLRAIFENSLNAIVVADDQGNYSFVNQAAAQMFGYTEKQLLEMNVGQIRTSIPENAAELYAKYLEKGKEIGEFQFLHSSGEKRIAKYHAVRIRDNFHLSILTDVTDEKAISEELQKYTDRLERAQEIGKTGTWNLDIATGDLEWTEQTYNIFGIEPGMPVNLERFFALVHPDDADSVSLAWDEALNGKEYDVIHRTLVGDQLKWVREKAEVTFDESGNALEALGISQDITEQKKLEEERQRLELIMAEAGNLANIGGWDLELSTMTSYYSDQTKRIYGLPLDEDPPPGIEGMKFYPKEAQPLIQEAVRAAIEEGKEYDIEVPFINAHGKNLWVRTMGKPVKEDGKPVKLYGTFQDITSQREANQKLKESQEQFFAAFNSSPMPMSITNLDTGERIAMNDKFCEILEYSKEEAEARNLYTHHFAADGDELKKAIELAKQDKLYGQPFQMKTKTGRILDVEISSIRMNPDNPDVHVITYMDVTERTAAERGLKQSQQRFLAAFNSSPMPMSIMNFVTGERLELNQRFCEVFEFSYEEAMQRNLLTGHLAYDEKELRKAVKLALTEKGLYDYPFKMLTKSGKIKDLEVSAVLLNPENSEIFVITYLDVTERKEAEQQLKQSEESLRRIILATSGKRGQDYFDSMAKVLEEVTHSTYSFIGRYQEDNSVMTMALSHRGKILDNFKYDLEGTPCNDVISKESCIYPAGITELYPKDQLLIDMGIEAYAGTPILNADGTPMGIIVSLYDKPLKETAYIKTLFEIFASTIGAEMVRLEYEQQSKESEEKYRSQFEQSLDAIFLTNDSDGSIFDANHASGDLLGYSKEEILQMKSTDLIAPGHLENAILEMDAQMEKEKSFSLETKMFTKDGREIDVSASGRPITINDKTSFQLIARDITAAKEIERLERRNEQVQSDAQRLAKLGYWIYDLKQDLFTSAEINYETHDIDPGPVDVKTLQAKIHPDDLTSYQAGFRRWLEGDVSEDLEYRILRRDGSVTHLYATCKPEYNEAGELIRLFGSAQDVTERKLVEERLAESDRITYNAIINSEEKERARYAKELHDGLGPLLSTSMIYLHTLEAEEDLETRNANLARTNELLSSAAQTLKEITNNLSPEILIRYGLVPAIKSFIDKLDQMEGLKVLINSTMACRFADIIEFTLFRATTELVNNTLKHANASTIKIDLKHENDHLELSYRDDGDGFEKAQEIDKALGYGLRNIENRISRINGIYAYESAPGQGVSVHISIKTPCLK